MGPLDKRPSMKRDLLRFGVLLVAVLVVNVLSGNFFFRLDLTEDQRYTISPATKHMLDGMDQSVEIEILLDGEIGPDFERLRKTIRETVEEFDVYAGESIDYYYTDPNVDFEDDTLAKAEFWQRLFDMGVQYTFMTDEQGGESTQRVVFPAALIHYGGKTVPVSFFKWTRVADRKLAVNASIENIEYELATALRKVTIGKKKVLAFLHGHGELDTLSTASIRQHLRDYYQVVDVDLSRSASLEGIDAFILAQPTQKFSEVDKFKIDQYVVKGGRGLILIDEMQLLRDSLNPMIQYGVSRDLNLRDMLFKFGVRLNANYIQDLTAGSLSNGQQTARFPFFPLLYNYSKHPIVRNMDAIIAKFIGTMDTVRAAGIRKTPLVFTSNNCLVSPAPVQVNFGDIGAPADEKYFVMGPYPVAYLLEGTFSSIYTGRPAPMPGGVVTETGKKEGKLIVISDGEVIKNSVGSGGQPVPLGADPAAGALFSNKDFVSVSIDYLMGEEGIINTRAKVVELRPLDNERIQSERLKWQLINLGAPILLLILFALGRAYWRKRSYARFLGFGH